VTPAQAQVLHLLAGAGRPITAADLATVRGLHTNTAREHLDALVGLGLVRRDNEPPSGRGRPAYRYAVAPAPSPVGAHAALVTALVDHLAAAETDPRAAAVQLGAVYGRDHGAEADAPGEHRSPERRATSLITSAMTTLGFSPEPIGGGADLVLRTCPLLDAARHRPEVVCGFHEGLVQGLAEQAGVASALITLTPFSEPDGCRLQLLASSGC